MHNVTVRMLEQDEFHRLEEFCEEEGIPMLNPEWAKVVALIDTDLDKVVGIVVCQMQIHNEPIWIKKEYQNRQRWKEMAEVMEGYLDMLALTSGVSIGVYNQPTNAAAERICRMRGYEKSDKPLYTKVYTGEGLIDKKE